MDFDCSSLLGTGGRDGISEDKAEDQIFGASTARGQGSCTYRENKSLKTGIQTTDATKAHCKAKTIARQCTLCRPCRQAGVSKLLLKMEA